MDLSAALWQSLREFSCPSPLPLFPILASHHFSLACHLNLPFLRWSTLLSCHIPSSPAPYLSHPPGFTFQLSSFPSPHLFLVASSPFLSIPEVGPRPETSTVSSFPQMLPGLPCSFSILSVLRRISAIGRLSHVYDLKHFAV